MPGLVDPAPVLQLDGVQRHYPGSPPVRALCEATFAVQPGELVAVVGRSGSGKSTLLNVLGLLDNPTGGLYRVGGRDVRRLADHARTELRSAFFGFVFQQAFLLPARSAQENVELPLVPARVGPRERRMRAWEMLERVGLGNRRRFLPTTLSGGECQRVALARALVHHPSVLLCDEPTGNLDSRTSDEIVDLLMGTCDSSGMTLMMVTHDLDIAARFRRVLTVSDGYVSGRDDDGP